MTPSAAPLSRLASEAAPVSTPRRMPLPWWPNLLSFLLTLLSTTVFGAALADSFARGRGLDEQSVMHSVLWLLHGDARLQSGFAYSLPLLAILLAHEFGHYLSCKRWQVEATLPYFGPSPTLLGTIGAFIWIRSPIYSRRSLFDIGVNGPLCGFAVLVPCLAAGIEQSRLCPGGGTHSLFTFGTPFLLALFEHFRFPGVPASSICLHPTAIAAWAGMLATAINLLPVGQLDGGHISFAVLGARWHSYISYATIASLVLAGFVYWPWWIWAVGLFFFRRHPFIYDERPLNTGRRALGIAALLLLLFSFALVPVRVA